MSGPLRSLPILLLLAFAACCAAQQSELELGVQVLDLEARQIDHAAAILSFPGDADRDLKPKGNLLLADLNPSRTCGTGNVQAFNIDVSAPGSVLRRRLALLVTRICTTHSYTYKVHLAAQTPRTFNSAYVNEARVILDKVGPDAALAYLSPGWEDYQSHPEDKSDYCHLPCESNRSPAEP